jgi:hypothetical protein
MACASLIGDIQRVCFGHAGDHSGPRSYIQLGKYAPQVSAYGPGANVQHIGNYFVRMAFRNHSDDFLLAGAKSNSGSLWFGHADQQIPAAIDFRINQDLFRITIGIRIWSCMCLDSVNQSSQTSNDLGSMRRMASIGCLGAEKGGVVGHGDFSDQWHRAQHSLTLQRVNSNLNWIKPRIYNNPVRVFVSGIFETMPHRFSTWSEHFSLLRFCLSIKLFAPE